MPNVLEKQFYKNLIENIYDFSTVSGYAEGKFADFAMAAISAATRAHAFSRNPAFEPDDYFQELMVKAFEKAAYFDSADNLRGAVYSTAQNVAIDLWKKSRDWKGAPSTLVRVSMEDAAGVAIYKRSSSEGDEKERRAVIGEVLEELWRVFPHQMQTEALRSDPNARLSIEETAVRIGKAKKTVTNHRSKLRKYVWRHHAAARRQLFGPHRSKKARVRSRRVQIADTSSMRERHPSESIPAEATTAERCAQNCVQNSPFEVGASEWKICHSTNGQHQEQHMTPRRLTRDGG